MTTKIQPEMTEGLALTNGDVAEVFNVSMVGTNQGHAIARGSLATSGTTSTNAGAFKFTLVGTVLTIITG